MVDPYLEIKERLDGSQETFECRALKVTNSFAGVYYRLEHDRAVEDITLPEGTLSFGYFWLERPYNVYHWLEADGDTIGFYVNICDQVEINDEAVHWRDLVIDVLLVPGREPRILDKDEVPEDLPEAVAEQIERAQHCVLKHRPELSDHLRAQTGVWFNRLQAMDRLHQ